MTVARPYLAEIPTLSTAVLAALPMLLLVSLYLIKSKKHPIAFYGIPLIIFMILAQQYLVLIAPNQQIASDHYITSIILAIALIFYASIMHNILSPKTAVLAIVIAVFITHLLPARAPYMSDPDSHFFYRLADHIINTGDIMAWDDMTYPPKGHDAVGRWMVTVAMANAAQLLQPFGISSHDVAMVVSGVMAGLIAFIAYHLMLALFPDNQNKHLIGLFAAFFLLGSVGMSIRAIATNAEDDGMGLMFVALTLALMFKAYSQKDHKITALASLSYLLLALTWAGYEYLSMLIGIFIGAEALNLHLQKKNATGHLPYFLIPYLLSTLFYPIMHGGPYYTRPPLTIMGLLVIGVGVSVLLELLRVWRQKPDDNPLFTKYRLHMTVAFAIIGLMFAPTLLNFISESSTTTLQATGILDLTTAEQRSTGFDLQELYRTFGMAAFIGIGVSPFLLYRAYKLHETGSLFALIYGLSAIWGFSQMSRYAYIASVPIAALGATFMLYTPTARKELGLNVMIPILALAAIILYVPFTMDTSAYGLTLTMHMGMTADRYYWQPFFEWLNTTPQDTLVVSWWDYGHWITSLSERKSVLDNTKSDDDMVQQVAKLHVIETDECTAFSEIQAYNEPDIFVCDWSMAAGKSGAPHFIATSDLDNKTHGSWLGYATCEFARDASSINQVNPKTLIKETRLVFPCNAYIPALVFTITGDQQLSIQVVMDESGSTTSLSAFMQAHPMAVLGAASPQDILRLAMEQPDANLMPTARTFVLAPKMVDKGVEYDLRNVMMSQTYLGEYGSEYYKMGLCTTDWCAKAPNHLQLFEPVPEFQGLSQTSSGGYVKAWKINWEKYDELCARNESSSI